MLKNIFFSIAFSVAFLPTLAAAYDAPTTSSNYASCQKACSLNGLSCVIRCLQQIAPARPPQTDGYTTGTWWGGGGDDYKPKYDRDHGGSTARNFPTARPYNSDFSGRKR